MKVFIADDSQIIHERLTSILSDIEGVEVIGQAQAQDARKSVSSIQKLKPDVAILDVRISSNGINALKRIKRKHPSLIVIILTNHSYPQYRRKCMHEGADFFFDKSTEFDEVVKVFEKLLGEDAGINGDRRRGHTFSLQKSG